MPTLSILQKRMLAERFIGRKPCDRAAFLADLRRALESRSGFASGKIGPSPIVRLYYPIMLAAGPTPQQHAAFKKALRYHTLNQAGIFPTDPAFCLKFGELYAAAIAQLDSTGLFFDLSPMDLAVLRHYNFPNPIYFEDQEPDRSIPDRPLDCYLPFLRGRKVLIVCPFGELLRQRATEATFERVWSKTGKLWFHPSAVQAIEFPYGFETATQERYGSVIALMDEVKSAIAARDFDVALIAAAGMAIPLAGFIKGLGKVAIDLGGHLQVLFGVVGQRWRDLPEWREHYFNEHWIDMPAHYRPQATDVCDNGAYW